MKEKKFLLLFLLYSVTAIYSQSNFSVDAYKLFLQQNQNMESSELFEMYDAGYFKNGITSSPPALYLDSIDTKYGLTEYERELLENNGFMVSERLAGHSFGPMMRDIYNKDLPLFISTDAILHAFHCSYDLILMNVEIGFLIDKLKTILTGLKNKQVDLNAKYAVKEDIQQMLRDVDVYLTVPLKLLVPGTQPYYPENIGEVNILINQIFDERVVTRPFFSEIPRDIDFSQFKPRAHYDSNDFPQLKDYFRAMMWLGRIELYLSKPQTIPPPTDEDVKRQVIDAFLFYELFELSDCFDDYNQFEDFIKFFVGEPDNITIINLFELAEETGFENADELLDPAVYKTFKEILETKPYSSQRILSQILYSDPLDPDQIEPASAFMLFGQRFIIDSYVTGSVVYDKIIYNGRKIPRLFPNTLDILFATGNDAALHLLSEELEEYHYASNLAALRYLVDSYDNDFWESSIYNMWLSAIRTLSPPVARDELPDFMTTAAWWQEKMNTQLSSWTELRHDNLLYAKPSYTGGFGCSFPYVYIEPIPEFYEKMKTMAVNIAQTFSAGQFNYAGMKEKIVDFFSYSAGVYDTLFVIAQKELKGELLTEAEILFLDSTLDEQQGACAPNEMGWYPRLHYDYGNNGEAEYFEMPNYIVADFHTTPTDESGNLIGWVLHSGTGKIDMAVVQAEIPSGGYIAFVGPVMSYHEYTTTNFFRLTDSDWEDQYLNESLRPDWVNIYLANSDGNSRGDGRSLLTSINDDPEENIPRSTILAKNYPNPFNPLTTIQFTIPYDLTNNLVNVSVFNVQGEKIAELVNRELPAGNYLTRWNGTNHLGQKVSSGVYFYRIYAGGKQQIGKMNLLK